MNIYEMYGRLAETKTGDDEFIKNTLVLLGRIRDGEVLPTQLAVTETGWNVKDAPVEPEDA